MQNRQIQRNIKLVVLGESSVGKSCIVLRFVKGIFHGDQTTTIAADFSSHDVVVDEVIIRFNIWDTAGQERYHSLAPFYYRGADASIVVYDITRPETFFRAKYWIHELHEKASSVQVIVLCGNMCDLSDRRIVSQKEGQSFAEENGLLFMETSAKSFVNVEELFQVIARRLCIPRKEVSPPSNVVRVHQKQKSTAPSSCCASIP